MVMVFCRYAWTKHLDHATTQHYKKKLSVKIVFFGYIVNDGLFEHFLINKVRENVEIRESENIQ